MATWLPVTVAMEGIYRLELNEDESNESYGTIIIYKKNIIYSHNHISKTIIYSHNL